MKVTSKMREYRDVTVIKSLFQTNSITKPQSWTNVFPYLVMIHGRK